MKYLYPAAVDPSPPPGARVPILTTGGTASIGLFKPGEDKGWQHDRYVFTFRGRPITEIKTGFLAACVRSSLGQFDAEGSYTGFTWHGLRHTWATWHVQNGTPLEVLMKLGGWSDLRMVSHYAHHSPGFLASFANNNAKTKQ